MSQKEGITVVLSGVNPKVEAVLRRNNFEKLLGKENICSHIDLALARANEIISWTPELYWNEWTIPLYPCGVGES